MATMAQSVCLFQTELLSLYRAMYCAGQTPTCNLSVQARACGDKDICSMMVSDTAGKPAVNAERNPKEFVKL